MKSFFALITLLTVMLPVIAPGEPVASVSTLHALAITDPQVLRAFDASMPLPRMLDVDAPVAASTTNALFAMPVLAQLRGAVDADFKRFMASDDIGLGEAHAVRLFDRALLNSPATAFVLTGIINRGDRAYVAPEHCGEIRLIYRLQRTDIAPGLPRLLPMTLNLVFYARIPSDAPLTCADLAARWLAISDGVDEKTTADVLANLTPEHVDRIEINLQIAHTPKSATRAFRTDYLQKVFRRGRSGVFEEALMENQIDRDHLLADDALARDFHTWLLEPDHLAQFDAGTVLIPGRFLSSVSIAATPVGLARSPLHPSFGLMQSDQAKGSADTKPVFTDDDVVTALARASAAGFNLQNIRSPQGFARRLDDISCGGCHQVRGIGGFHFPGVDSAVNAGVAASPHFIGEQPRRRDIATAMRAGRVPDFSRGFSDRPQLRGDTTLAGTAMLDGWGAHCIRAPAPPAKPDASFSGWSCASGLTCQPVDDDLKSPIGMCFVGGR